ncbi:MAG: 3-oxoadipate enol-lactonase [Brevundimonas sp.]|uniref:3-oxoadipate enol-lactonase n=1 Tax=Brevundimonas sp. TaxID=1871086 RepID=UPI0027204C34|nr:3-oxoadipate enol-lactonase [Brevundimonas sp.]MDO9607918.1 3-oxoadipate enol-lactonase [Brevundimonas sp.]
MPTALTDDGVSLWWTEDGPADAPVLLLANSIGSTVEMWAPQVEPLAQRLRLIRFDTRGHGRSEAPEGDYTLDRLARDLAAVLDTAGAARAHVCGLSLGGAVAQTFALKFPDRLDRLILANTAARIGSADGWNQRIAAVRGGGMACIADMAVGRFFDAAFIGAHPEVIAPVRAALIATPAHGYIGCCAALRDADLSEAVAAINSPTLVIGGASDVSTPPVQTQALADAIPGARHIVLDAAHLSNLEQPDAFTGAVIAHLES